LLPLEVDRMKKLEIWKAENGWILAILYSRSDGKISENLRIFKKTADLMKEVKYQCDSWGVK